MNSMAATGNKDYIKPSSILITGAAGFIGSNVLRYLWKQYPDTHFHVLDALTYAGDLRNIDAEIHMSPRFTFHYGDVRNDRLVDRLVKDVGAVIHFAAETHVARSIHDDADFFSTDVIGTQVIASAVLRHRDTIKRFIHISTSEVYGTARTDRMAEDHPLEPMSPYAAAKVGADRLVYSYIQTYKIPAVIIRPFNMYGPNQHLEKVIPRFITSVLLGEPMTVHGTGQSRRDFTYVEDLARALHLVLEAPAEMVEGEVFNVGNDIATSVLDIANLVQKFIQNSLPDHMEQPHFTNWTLNIGDRPGQVFKHQSNTDKIRGRLGWRPQVTLEDGIRRTIEWYAKNRPWWEHKVWMRHVTIETAEGKKELH